jgi:hypothetical protein
MVKPETETKTDYEQYFEKVETFFYKSAIDAHLGGVGGTPHVHSQKTLKNRVIKIQ